MQHTSNQVIRQKYKGSPQILHTGFRCRRSRYAGFSLGDIPSWGCKTQPRALCLGSNPVCTYWITRDVSRVKHNPCLAPAGRPAIENHPCRGPAGRQKAAHRRRRSPVRLPALASTSSCASSRARRRASGSVSGSRCPSRDRALGRAPAVTDAAIASLE